jgi:ribulose-5-phosphate 4-epimerase/fuculose-1-phosphate aldolase
LLDPITQDVCAFHDDHALFDDYTGVVLDLEEGKRLAHALGGGKAVILRNHGLLTVGKTVGEAFNWMHRLELSCRSQLAAMATGEKLRSVPKPVLSETYLNYQPQTRRPFGVMEWPALLRKLDRMDPSFRY